MVELPNTPLRCLSMWNPWAWALFRAGKRIENRDWRSKFRGWISIQVSMHWELNEVRELVEAVKKAASLSGKPGLEVDLHELYEQRGHIIGMIRIDDWKPAFEYNNPWAFSEGFGAHVAEAVEIEPVSCRGMPGLFYLPLDVENSVREKFASACTKGATPIGEENASDDDSFRLV